MTSGEISYTLPGHSLYKSIEKAASGERFPHLVKNAKKEVLKITKALKKYQPSVIFSAPSHQTNETAKVIAQELGLKMVVSKNLLPLRFNLKNLITEREFNSLGDNKFKVLRVRFINNFFQDKLIDKNKEIKKRFERLTGKILKNHKNQAVVVVSHAYIIKLFSIYHKIGNEMFKTKQKLLKMFQPTKEPLRRLETLVINFK